jgi:hypothetical protein
MRNIKARTVLLSVGMSTLVLAAAIGSALAKQAHTRAHAEITKSTHCARHWKRHRIYAASRERVTSPRYARVYYRRVYPRPWASYETDLLFDCLMSQPFVICP